MKPFWFWKWPWTCSSYELRYRTNYISARIPWVRRCDWVATGRFNGNNSLMMLARLQNFPCFETRFDLWKVDDKNMKLLIIVGPRGAPYGINGGNQWPECGRTLRETKQRDYEDWKEQWETKSSGKQRILKGCTAVRSARGSGRFPSKFVVWCVPFFFSDSCGLKQSWSEADRRLSASRLWYLRLRMVRLASMINRGWHHHM